MKLLTTNNSKLKKDGIAAFSLPAGKTCPFAGTCKAFCYAQKGRFRFPVVKAAKETRFLATRIPGFDKEMAAECRKAKQNRFRIHDSGDFYNQAYLEKWLRVITENPTKEFYAYTKSVRYLLGRELPPNMRAIFSYGGKDDVLINPKVHRHARIFGTKQELDAAGYVDASQSDMVAATTKSLKIGLIKH